MANDYYSNTVRDFLPGTRARGPAVDDALDSVEAGFDQLPAPAGVAGQGFSEPVEVGDALTDADALNLGQFKVWPVLVTVDLSGCRLTNAGDPVDAQDLATKAYVVAEILAGGDPADIPITSLGIGTLAEGEYPMRSGASIVGAKDSKVTRHFFGNS